jgi:hypothetical protein
MFKQCWQIFLTYARRRIFWAIGAFFVFGWLMLGIGIFGTHRAAPKQDNMQYLSFGFFFVYYYGMVVYHLKQQIATPQASLIPGYRVPHLIVALVMLFPILVLVPVVASLGYGLPIVPVLSLHVAFFTLVTWGVYRNSWMAMLAALACFYAPAAPQVRTLFLDRFVTDPSLGNSLAALPILALGVGGLALTARRLLALREEMREYTRTHMSYRSPFSNAEAGPRAMPQINWDSWWIRWQFSQNVDELGQSTWNGTPSGKGFWRRVKHRRAAYNNRVASLPRILLFTAMFAFWIGLSSHETINFVGSFLFLVPAYTAFVQQFARWPTLGYESLRPARRQDFVLENAGAFAWNMAEAWLTMALAFALVAALLAPGLYKQGDVALVLTASALFQVLPMSIAWWFLRVRSTAILVGLAMCSGLTFAPLGIFTKDLLHVSPIWIAGGAGVIVLAAALISLDAYRRWMRMDLA